MKPEDRANQILKKSYLPIAEFFLRRPLFILQDEKKNKEFFDWCKEQTDAKQED